MKNLERLDDQLREKIPEINWMEFLTFLRWNYYKKWKDIPLEKLIKNSGTIEPTKPFEDENLIRKCLNFKEDQDIHWGDYKFHLSHRIHLHKNEGSQNNLLNYIAEFSRSVPDLKINSAFLLKIVNEGIANSHDTGAKRFFDLSILPLNILLGNEVTKYFIPPEDYLEPHFTKKGDPYGIIHGVTRAKIKDTESNRVVIVDDDKNILGSHKFSHTLLFNIDFYCPIGCSDCYKTRFGTREFTDKEFKHKFYSLEEIGEIFPPTKAEVVQQTKKTVQWMNNTLRGQQVYDVILSGGEPLYTLSNETLKDVLKEFAESKYLKVFRICTGSIFLGLPFRIDHELLDILIKFSESTGIKVTFQAHLGNHHMISPESIIAIKRIRRKGIPIYSQIPIKNGINFFLEDREKTLNELIELGRKQNIIGVEPYMFIVDMHPSTNAFYVPIEPLLQVWGDLVESHDYPGLERPRTLSLLFEQGNVILSGNNLLVMKKFINKDLGYVEYRIPRIGGDVNWVAKVVEPFVYREPLFKGINDDSNSLNQLKEHWG